MIESRCDFCLRELILKKTVFHNNHGRRVRVDFEVCTNCGIKYKTRLKEHHGWEWRSHGRKVVSA